MADVVSAIPYGNAAQGQGLFGTSSTAAVWAYSPWDSTTVSGTVGTPAGTSPPTPVTTGTNARGTLTFGTGTNPSPGIMATVTFGTALPSTPVVVISPTNGPTAALNMAVTGASTTGFNVYANTTPAASQGGTAYAVCWQMML